MSAPPPWPTGFVPKYAYAVNFICNPSPNTPPASKNASPAFARNMGLLDGFYQTDINIHNPSYSTTKETIVKKFLAIPETPMPLIPQPPPFTQFVPAAPSYVLRWATLDPDAAMRLDSGEILTVLSNTTTPLQWAKGFVIIYSDTNLLDVWVEYTTLGAQVGVHPATAGPTPALTVVKIPPSPYVP